MEIPLDKEIQVLALMDQLNLLLRGDLDLQDKVAERLETGGTGRDLRNVVLRRRASLSYYNEDYAMQLKPYLNRMIESDCTAPIEFPKHKYPGTALRTIYLRVYQAWQYLRDHDAEKAKYIELWGKCQITQPRTGIRIIAKKSRHDELTLVGVEIEEKLDDILPLLNEIETAITTQVSQKTIVFEKNKLSLSPESIEKIRDSMLDVEGITAIVEPNRIKILKSPLGGSL